MFHFSAMAVWEIFPFFFFCKRSSNYSKYFVASDLQTVFRPRVMDVFMIYLCSKFLKKNKVENFKLIRETD
jgi:hypothetical protein